MKKGFRKLTVIVLSIAMLFAYVPVFGTAVYADEADLPALNVQYDETKGLLTWEPMEQDDALVYCFELTPNGNEEYKNTNYLTKDEEYQYQVRADGSYAYDVDDILADMEGWGWIAVGDSYTVSLSAAEWVGETYELRSQIWNSGELTYTIPPAKIRGVTASNGWVNWHAYEGGEFDHYEISVENPQDTSKSFAREVDMESDCFALDTWIDALIMNNELTKNEEGIYAITVAACDADDTAIAEGTTTYQYSSSAEPVEVGRMTGITWDPDTKILSWDTYEDPNGLVVSDYAYTVQCDETHSETWYTEGETQVDLTSVLEELREGGQISEGDALRFYVTANTRVDPDDPEGERIAIARTDESEYVDYIYQAGAAGYNVQYDPRTGELTWDAVEGATDYWVDLYRGDHETSLNGSNTVGKTKYNVLEHIASQVGGYTYGDFPEGTLYSIELTASLADGTELTMWESPAYQYVDPNIEAIEDITLSEDGTLSWYPDINSDVEQYFVQIGDYQAVYLQDAAWDMSTGGWKKLSTNIYKLIDAKILDGAIEKSADDTYEICIESIHRRTGEALSRGYIEVNYASQAEPVEKGTFEVSYDDETRKLSWEPYAYEDDFAVSSHYWSTLISRELGEMYGNYMDSTPWATNTWANMIDNNGGAEPGEEMDVNVVLHMSTNLEDSNADYTVATGSTTWIYQPLYGELEVVHDEEQEAFTWNAWDDESLDHYAWGIAGFEWDGLQSVETDLSVSLDDVQSKLQEYYENGNINDMTTQNVVVYAYDAYGGVLAKGTCEYYFEKELPSIEVTQGGDGMLNWKPVDGANQYRLMIGNDYDTAYTYTETLVNFAKQLDWIDRLGRLEGYTSPYDVTLEALSDDTVIARWKSSTPIDCEPQKLKINASWDANSLLWTCEEELGEVTYEIRIAEAGGELPVEPDNARTARLCTDSQLLDVGRLIDNRIKAGTLSVFGPYHVNLRAVTSEGYEFEAWDDSEFRYESSMLIKSLPLYYINTALTAGVQVNWKGAVGLSSFKKGYETWTDVSTLDDPAPVILSSLDEEAIPEDGKTYRYSITLNAADNYWFNNPLSVTFSGKRYNEADGDITVVRSSDNKTVEITGFIDDVTAKAPTSIEDCEFLLDNVADQGTPVKYTYDGQSHRPQIEVFDNGEPVSGDEYTIWIKDDGGNDIDQPINAGRYTITVKGKGRYTGEKSFTMWIGPKVIDVPKAKTGLVYTGSQQDGVTVPADAKYTVSDYKKTSAGTYTATATLTDPDNYAWWPDGTNDPKDIPFTIAKATQSFTAKAGASSVAVGKTTTISVSGNKGAKSFKSSNTAVATVDANGKVTAKKVGTATITVSCASTTNYKAASKTITIKVVPAATSSITVTNQVTGTKVTWKKVTGATGYKIYRNGTLIKTIASGSTVSYADTKANTNGTKYTYKIVAKAATGDSTLSKSKVYYRVSRPAISSLTNSAAGKMTVKWGKNAKATGYEIQYSTSSTFASGNKTAKITKNTTVSKVISSLTKGKTYYVRIRTYKTVNGVNYNSAWSVKKSVKIAK